MVRDLSGPVTAGTCLSVLVSHIAVSTPSDPPSHITVSAGMFLPSFAGKGSSLCPVTHGGSSVGLGAWIGKA